MRTNLQANQLLLAIALLVASHLAIASEDSGLLKKLGLEKGQSYSTARATLVKRGWQIDYAHAENNQTSPYGFKEVVCGNGWQAVCSARFMRASQEIMLTLQPKKQLLVEGASNDKP